MHVEIMNSYILFILLFFCCMWLMIENVKTPPSTTADDSRATQVSTEDIYGYETHVLTTKLPFLIGNLVLFCPVSFSMDEQQESPARVLATAYQTSSSSMTIHEDDGGLPPAARISRSSTSTSRQQETAIMTRSSKAAGAVTTRL